MRDSLLKMETVMRLKLVNYLKERRLTQSTTAADAGIARGISLLVLIFQPSPSLTPPCEGMLA